MISPNGFRLARVLLLVTLLFLISIKGPGQCLNEATINLSSSSGSACYLTPVTVSGNTFGGSATMVIITENGDGSVVPAFTFVSPYTFTYTPGRRDVGKNIEITVTTDNPPGAQCKAAKAKYTLTVSPTPAAPVIATISHPTCAISTGSVVLSGLPSTGTWTVTRTPGGVTMTGTGTSTTISTIPGGTYTFTVTNSSGCISPPSENAIINIQPPTPAAPLVGIIVAPTCTLPTGSVELLGLPSSGTWTLTRFPGTVTTTGTGTNTNISGLDVGEYYYSIRDENGCISVLSLNVTIPVQPPTPTPPVVGTVTQPTGAVMTGSVVLSGLPAPGTWIINRFPDNVTIAGTGTSKTITGIVAGVFTFTVTNSFRCTSTPSEEVIISTPALPLVIITDPPTVCSPATVDITAYDITAGSTSGLTYTYWTDPEATITYRNAAKATEGTYYIKGTAHTGSFDIKPVSVTVDQMTVSDAGPDQILEYTFSTALDAQLNDNETGIWSMDSGLYEFERVTDPKTVVSSLSPGNNNLLWIVTIGVCPADTDQVSITVRDLVIPTLITPNGDSNNEYFKLSGLETLGKTELIIFDKRGALVYKNSDYDNKWNGIDFNDKPLINDTYFYVLKSANGKSLSGYILIRR